MQLNPQSRDAAEIPAEAVHRFSRQALLKGIMAEGAGFAAGGTQPFDLQRVSRGECLLLYCTKGSGWCEASGLLRTFKQGDLVLVAPGVAYRCRTRPTKPWVIHWACASGDLIPDYIAALHPARPLKVHEVGDDLELSRLFAEILSSLKRGADFPHVLRASYALSHMLAVLVQKRGNLSAADQGTPHKVAETIVYMSEHLHETVRVPALARLANLAPTYFTALFKQHTGCAPRDYLHLLRIHRACQLLSGTGLSIKQISNRVGYQDAFHFSRQFKAFQGVSPSTFRESAPGTSAEP